jgi:hypothetical protein
MAIDFDSSGRNPRLEYESGVWRIRSDTQDITDPGYEINEIVPKKIAKMGRKAILKYYRFATKRAEQRKKQEERSMRIGARVQFKYSKVMLNGRVIQREDSASGYCARLDEPLEGLAEIVFGSSCGMMGVYVVYGGGDNGKSDYLTDFGYELAKKGFQQAYRNALSIKRKHDKKRKWAKKCAQKDSIPNHVTSVTSKVMLLSKDYII